MKRILVVVGIVLLTALLSVACGGDSDSSPSPDTQAIESDITYEKITAVQLEEMLQDKDFLLVNTHIPYDGEIPQTDLFIPYNQIEDHLSDLPQSKDARIVVYCRSGPMSEIAAKVLVSLGFTNVWDLTGGMRAWQSAGFELDRKISGPRIHFASDYVSLGKATPDEVINYVFTFENVGDVPLIIHEVKKKALEGC